MRGPPSPLIAYPHLRTPPLIHKMWIICPIFGTLPWVTHVHGRDASLCTSTLRQCVSGLAQNMFLDFGKPSREKSSSCLEKALKNKPIESVSMLIPRGGGPQASAHTSLGFPPACFKLTWLALGSPKQILCSLISQYLICFLIYLTIKINPLTFNLSNLVKFWLSFFRVVLRSFDQSLPKSVQNLLHSVPNNSNNPKHVAKKIT